MAQTSINIQPVRGGSEQHNKRGKKLDYVRSELSHLNDYWEKDTQAHRLATIQSKYLSATGQKMQAKATPIREAVVVIKPETTMDELKKLSEAYRQRFGIDTFQIAIHKDEGFHKAKEWKPNLHAHMVFDWTNPTNGKSLKLNRQDMVEMQTITAEILGMERGVPSDKKHLNAIQFKIATLETQIKELSKEIDELNLSKQTKESLNLAFERIKGFLGQSTKDKTIKALEGLKNGLESKIKKHEENLKSFQRQAQLGFKKQEEQHKAELSRKDNEVRMANQEAKRHYEATQRAEKRAAALYQAWLGKDAIKAAMQTFRQDINRRGFTKQEVAIIDQALGVGQDATTRQILAQEVMKELGSFAGCAIAERELRDIATREWQQGKDRGQGVRL